MLQAATGTTADVAARLTALVNGCRSPRDGSLARLRYSRGSPCAAGRGRGGGCGMSPGRRSTGLNSGPARTAETPGRVSESVDRDRRTWRHPPHRAPQRLRRDRRDDERLWGLGDGPTPWSARQRGAVRGVRSVGSARRRRAGIVWSDSDPWHPIRRRVADLDDRDRGRGPLGAGDRSGRQPDRGLQPDRPTRRGESDLARP